MPDTGPLIVEVVDDGIGGADTERGSGLRGLADRVEALGGRLRVWTPVRRRNPSQGGDPVRVVIAEDSVLLREGLERLLVDNGFEVVGTCETGEDLLAMVNGRAPDVAIVDIRLPPTHSDEGLRAALEIRADHPDGRRARLVAVPRARSRAEAARPTPPTGSATCSRTGSATSRSSSASVRRVADGGSALDPTHRVAPRRQAPQRRSPRGAHAARSAKCSS